MIQVAAGCLYLWQSRRGALVWLVCWVRKSLKSESLNLGQDDMHSRLAGLLSGYHGGQKFINKNSLYSLRNIFAFVKICCILENYYRTNIKKYLY